MLSALPSQAGRAVVRVARNGSAPRIASRTIATSHLSTRFAASRTGPGEIARVGGTQPVPSLARSLHASAPARSAGESDEALSGKLSEEINYEKESAATSASEGEPAFLADFRKSGVWKIEDQPGSDEIALTREFGNEHIRVLFSIGDIDTAESDMDENEDEESGKEEGDEESESPSFPVRCAITISKPKNGAMTIDAQALDGSFTIENISFYKDAKLATDLTAEADWARRGLYIGPQFETLDEDVQAQFESFLEERGIATDLALFIPSFAELKEQREYCAWLENVKAFVDA